jgi:hypothetical protein
MRRMENAENSYSFPLAFSVPIGVIAHHHAVILGGTSAPRSTNSGAKLAWPMLRFFRLANSSK